MTTVNFSLVVKVLINSAFCCVQAGFYCSVLGIILYDNRFEIISFNLSQFYFHLNKQKLYTFEIFHTIVRKSLNEIYSL